MPVAALGLALAAAGCAMDDVELNGGVFDMMGVSPSTKSKGGEPKVAERAPLVVPPALDRLPAPGEAAPTDPQLAAIKDPDEEKRLSQEELERRQAEYCAKNYSPNDASTDSAEGPLGPCRPSVLTAIKKWNGE